MRSGRACRVRVPPEASALTESPPRAHNDMRRHFSFDLTLPARARAQRITERVEELAVSFDLNQMLVESHAVVEERAGVDRLALESQERAQALAAEQQHRLDELATEKQMQVCAAEHRLSLSFCVCS
eukprot:COSAG01_NODE_12290_length_1765_cov_1.403361_1_plen_126_part_10